MRLSEALALAVPMGAPIFITRSLLASVTTLDLTTQSSASSWEELEGRGKDMQTLGREERLPLEEAMRRALAPYRHSRLEEFSERLWARLLERLTGARDDIAAAELRALDVATAFPHVKSPGTSSPWLPSAHPINVRRPGFLYGPRSGKGLYRRYSICASLSQTKTRRLLLQPLFQMSCRHRCSCELRENALNPLIDSCFESLVFPLIPCLQPVLIDTV
jgi:hypothetical protein